MNPPNTLTLSRLALAFVMMVLLMLSFPFARSLALLVFLVAALTDFLDGYLARNVYGVTSFGKLMDPLTDKVLVCAAFVSFVEMQLVPAWIAVVIITREFLVTGLRLLAGSQGKVISAGTWGKHKTLWQIVAIVLILLGLAIQQDVLGGAVAETRARFDHLLGVGTLVVSYAVVAITLMSGAVYFVQHRDLINER